MALRFGLGRKPWHCPAAGFVFVCDMGLLDISSLGRGLSNRGKSVSFLSTSFPSRAHMDGFCRDYSTAGCRHLSPAWKTPPGGCIILRSQSFLKSSGAEATFNYSWPADTTFRAWQLAMDSHDPSPPLSLSPLLVMYRTRASLVDRSAAVVSLTGSGRSGASAQLWR